MTTNAPTRPAGVLTWLRSTLFNAVMVGSVVPYAIVVCTLGWLLPRRARYWLVVGWPWSMVHLARLICGIRWRVEGLEHLPPGAALFLCKHQSAWETCALLFMLRREISYVFKRELLWLPFFGWGLAMLRMIYIDRKAGAEAFRKLIEQGQKHLAQGISIVIFPEGTRVARGLAGDYHSGGARLAQQTGVNIVPVAVTSARCWGRNAYLKFPGDVVLRIGPPIATQGTHYKVLTGITREWIESAMRELDAPVYAASQPQAQA